MRIIEPYYEILDPMNRNYILRKIEKIGRVCYKSEDKITNDSASRFVRSIVKSGHESVIEHFSFSVRFVVDRAVSHEIVRHRIASFSQESQRYCNYSTEGQVTFIRPFYLTDGSNQYLAWRKSCEMAEKAYLRLLDQEMKPEEARAVLPNSTKTEIVMTANLREWRHFFRLRTDLKAHPQMRQIMLPLYHKLRFFLPEVFDQ